MKFFVMFKRRIGPVLGLSKSIIWSNLCLSISVHFPTRDTRDCLTRVVSFVHVLMV